MPGARKEDTMLYRKVGYAEQCWYMLKAWFRMKFRRKEKKHAKKT